MSRDLVTLIDDVTRYGTIAGSFARYYLYGASCKPADMDIFPFSLQDAHVIQWMLEKKYGYHTAKTTENAFNMTPEGGFNHDNHPEIDVILRDRVHGTPTTYLPIFPLHNEAFAMVNPNLGIALDTAIEAESRQAIVVQNWYKDTHLRVGKLLFKERADGLDYHLDIVSEYTLRDFIGGKDMDKVLGGAYRNITSHAE